MSERTDPEIEPEIEDVLASIRRMVSEDAKGGDPDPGSGERPPVTPLGPSPAAPGALVLTPDFRVHGGQAGREDPRAGITEEEPRAGRTPSAEAAGEREATAGAEEAESADPAKRAEEGAPLDEDALRDVVRELLREELAGGDLRLLIADVLREELQGALGERITRNVRKLVRREIGQALAARDIE
ncbi:hypothetical protein BCF33_0033 [Hasllibacter halocynthiae]|uniref:Uncharacterized protein n=1 Tax=Hasllibacter halocynthiae TaxID=595589 RepID=A0A2T0X6D2_9RHOB|nr:hypothetical protein [Hasllibacter halocynthiae]PRY94445.1 hypothetical protein BCF33_0033 [Hasllibacter halocynthiae]